MASLTPTIRKEVLLTTEGTEALRAAAKVLAGQEDADYWRRGVKMFILEG